MTPPVPTVGLDRPRQALAVVFMLAAAIYLAWRVSVFNTAAPLLASGSLLAEALCLAAMAWRVLLGWRLSDRRSAPPAPRARGDVWVTAGLQPVDILRRSLRSAGALAGRGQVLLLLNRERSAADRQELAALCEKLDCRLVTGANPTEVARAALMQGDAELVLWMDGGHACRNDWLAQTAGHFQHHDVCAVQTADRAWRQAKRRDQPTAFTVEPADGRPLRHEDRAWDRWHAALWRGHGSVVRRAALDDALSARDAVAADPAAVSARWMARGWRVVWHDECLCFDITPEDAPRQPRPPGADDGVLSSLQLAAQPGLRFMQRLRLASAAFRASARVGQLGLLALPVGVVLTGQLPIDWAAVGGAGPVLLFTLPVLLSVAFLPAEISRGEQGWWQRQCRNLGRMPRPVLAMAFGFNAAALAGCLFAAGHWAGPAHLPVVSLLVGWAAVHSAYLLALLSVAEKPLGRERQRHRFLVTLGAELVGDNGERVKGTVDDLSEAGLRFYGSLLPDMTEGRVITGTLFLPDGPLPFAAEVRHLGGRRQHLMHQPRSVGLHLQVNPTSLARLETFLCVSDLRWHIPSHSDAALTPLRKLLPEAWWPPAPLLARRRWNGAQLREHILADATPVLCAASDPEDPQDLVISHQPLPEGTPLILDVYRRIAAPSRGVMLTRVPLPQSHAQGSSPGSLHAYRAEAAEMPALPNSHTARAEPYVLVKDGPLLTPKTPVVPVVLATPSVQLH